MIRSADESSRPGWEWALPLLRCPRCGLPVETLAMSADHADGVLGHASSDCPERYPVIAGIPRLLLPGARDALLRERREWFRTTRFAPLLGGWSADEAKPDLETAARFDHEWRRFGAVDLPELRTIFSEYFDLVPPSLAGEGSLVLDAGCGAGRWAYELGSRGARVIAIDLGLSIELAEKNTRPLGRVACVQADVSALPVADASVDLVCSLGVLHHVRDTERGLRELARVARPGGGVLVYLYYALDGRPSYYRGLFRAADVVRQVTSRSPQIVLVPVAAAIAALVYLPLARLARVLRIVGLGRIADGLPLSYYADRSLRTMMNDSLDRFGTRLEKRFTRPDVERLLAGVGLTRVSISTRAPYWHALGRR